MKRKGVRTLNHPVAPPGNVGLLLGAAAMLIALGGCMEAAHENAWSTRSDSIFDVRAQLSPETDLSTPIMTSFNDATLRESAVNLLKEASESTNPLLRANALEALQHAPEELPSIVQRLLGDENRGVRFIAAMTVGQHHLCELSHLVHPLLKDPSQSVQAAAIFAMRACGENVNPSPLGQMIVGTDPEVKANAAIVLGEMGDRSAVPMIRSAIGRDMPRIPAERVRIVDLQLAEAMVMLGAEQELEVIRAALFAPAEQQGEIVALACQMIGRLGDARAVPNLTDLASREGERQLPPEIRLAATMALAKIDPDKAPLDVALRYARHSRFEVRAQAATTLGHLADFESLHALRRLLSDANPLVQIAAAGAILQQIPVAQEESAI